MGYAKKLAAIACAAFSLGFASQSSADAVLVVGDARYLGNINDGIPSNPANEVDYINNLIDMMLNSGPIAIGTETYTRSGSSCGTCPDAVLAGSQKDETAPFNPFNVGMTGYTYILGKYDAGQAGSYVWYIAGVTGLVTLPNSVGGCGSDGCGLSHVSVYNPGGGPPNETPEPASLALLGIGLAGVALLRRRKQGLAR